MFQDYGLMCRCMDGIKSVYYDRPIEVISGHAKGADRLGERWADDQGFEVDVHKPDYAQFGRWRAPKLRNLDMANVGHVLVAFWDGKSTGTEHMIMTAIRKGLEVHIFRYE